MTKREGNVNLRTRLRYTFPVLVILTLFSLSYLNRVAIQSTIGRRFIISGKQSLTLHTNRDSYTSSSELPRSEDVYKHPHGLTYNLQALEDEDNQASQLISGAHPSKKFVFDPHGNDTLVVIHIQKTGGSEFLRNLMHITRNGQHLCKVNGTLNRVDQLRKELQKKRKEKIWLTTACPRDPLQPSGEQWLISERTVRWICGVHASYTEFQYCLSTLASNQLNSNSNIHYMTFLRHPVLRYISEFLHVQRNASWSKAMNICHGQPVSPLDMPPCYPGYYDKKPWTNLTLSSFISCESNWANNRQTLMVADLEAIRCFKKGVLSREERDKIILKSAMKNLESFSFFGLTEYMNESCSLFENHFGVELPVRPSVRNLASLHSGPMLPHLWNHTLFNSILRVNNLDVKLYNFALSLFSKRAKEIGVEVNKERVEQEIKMLQINPQSIKIGKGRKHINYNII